MQSMFLAYLFAALFLLKFFCQCSQPNGMTIDNQCYECASTELQFKWHLTGLPPPDKVIRNKFIKTCNNLANVDTVQCPGYCYTLMFEDPESKNLLKLPHDPTTTLKVDIYFVRACHTNIVPVLPTFQLDSEQKFCEYDPAFSMRTSVDDKVPVQMLVEFCITQKQATTATTPDFCNKRASKEKNGVPENDFPDLNKGTNKCEGQRINNTIGTLLLQCYECDGFEQNCYNYEKPCSKKYCLTSTAYFGDNYQIRKTCTDVNPYGINEYCMNRPVIMTPGAINSLQLQGVQCYCKDRQYCNGSSKVAIHISILIAVAVFAAKIMAMKIQFQF